MGRILLFVLLVPTQVLAQIPDCVPALKSVGPDSPVRVSIRCQTTRSSKPPLFVVNGIPADSSDMARLDPNTILTIDILKSGPGILCSQPRDVVIIKTKSNRHLTILDADDNQVLEGATVKILPDKRLKAASLSIADKNGEIDLSQLEPKQEYKMEVSCIGYKTKTVVITGKETNYAAKLEKDYKKLSDLTVVAYPIIRCRSLTCTCPGTIIKTLNSPEKENVSSFAFVIYPNPVSVSGSITLKASQLIEGKAEVINSSGQVIQSINFESNKSLCSTVALTSVSSGVYFVRLTNTKTQKSVTGKLIVQ